MGMYEHSVKKRKKKSEYKKEHRHEQRYTFINSNKTPTRKNRWLENITFFSNITRMRFLLSVEEERITNTQ